MYILIGSLALLLVCFAIFFVYFKNHQYGWTLAIVSVLFITAAVSWNLTEDSRQQKQLHKIAMTELPVSNASLQAEYGNRYLYQADVINQSQQYQLVAIQFRLTLNTGGTEEIIDHWHKLWLNAGQQQTIKVYFSSTQLAVTPEPGKWSVQVLATKAR